MRNPVMFIVEIGSGPDDVSVPPRLLRRRRHAERVRRSRRGLAVVHRAVRQLRRGDGRRARQGAGRHAAQDAGRDGRRESADADGTIDEKSSSALAASATCASSSPARSSPATARSSRASPRSTSRRSPVSRRRSSASRAATARRSPAARGCCRDEIVVRITSKPGETFLDRMIALVEGANRQKTPNEIALNILLAGLDHHLPARGRHAAAVRDLLAAPSRRSSCSSRSWCA